MTTKSKIKIAHLTSAHERSDVRIFLKECSSLAESGFETSLIVADSKGNELNSCINIIDVGQPTGRVNRIFNTTRRILNAATLLDADIYHLHDPELMPIGIKLKNQGKKVIFDAHEDLPKQILAKPYLNKIARKSLSFAASTYEQWAAKKFDAIVTATPFIRDKFLKINPNTIDINNYPKLGELDTYNIDWSSKKNSICYIGGLTKVRGIEEIVQALSQLKHQDIRLQIGGAFSEETFEQLVKELPSWQTQVDFLGWLNRTEVSNIMETSIAGLVTLHPIINYLDALPVKMFEYMAAGIPVIASDFPLWISIIEKNQCGICVNPLNSKEISEAIDFIIENPEQAKLMGENGRVAILTKYNWNIESTKLIDLYRALT